MLPLHAACVRNAPAALTELLLRAFPEGVSATTCHENTPADCLRLVTGPSSGSRRPDSDKERNGLVVARLYGPRTVVNDYENCSERLRHQRERCVIYVSEENVV